MAHESVTRRLAAIVVADMVGYSRLMQLDEAGIVTRQKACLEELINPKIKEHGGRLVKTTGDGILLEFASAVDAVLCSVAIQREMVAREAAISEDRRIQYRVGINLGEIIIEDDDIFGDGVNVAARLETLAEPGGIRISRAVFNNVKGKLDLGFSDLGPQKVKNIDEPIPTYRVLLDPDDVGKLIKVKVKPTISKQGMAAIAVALVLVAITGYFALDAFAPTQPTTPDEPRLLVLPFTSESDDAKIYSDGASENLWISFARLRGLTMVPREESVKFAGIDPTPDQIQQLGEVTHVLGGSIAIADGNISISSYLQENSKGKRTVKWQKQVDGPAEKPFELLAQLKTGVVASMKVPLNSAELEILQKVPTRSMQAYLLFAGAYRLHQKGHWNDQKKAISNYKEAMRVDPLFIDAKTAYARINFSVWYQGWNIVRNTLEAKADAERFVEEILAKDPSNGAALAVKAGVKLFSGNRDGALAVMQGAVFQNADDPNIRITLAQMLIASAKYEQARAELEKAIELSARLPPRDLANMSWHYLRLGDGERALDLLGQIKGENAKTPFVYGLLADAYARTGKIEKARENARKQIQQWPSASLVWVRDTVFNQFEDPAIYEAYADALLKAGIPEWPFNYDHGKEGDQLRGEELAQRFADNNYRVVDGEDWFGQPFKLTLNKDGSTKMAVVWAPGIEFSGRWEIISDELCFRYPAWIRGRQFCDRVYIDREKFTDEKPRYVRLNNLGLLRFSLERSGN